MKIKGSVNRKKLVWTLLSDLTTCPLGPTCLSAMVAELFHVPPPSWCETVVVADRRFCAGCLNQCHARQRHDADIPSYIISLTGPNRKERRHAARLQAKTGEILQLRPKVNWDRYNDEHRCHWLVLSKHQHHATYAPGQRRELAFQCRHLRQAPSIFCRNHQNPQLSLLCTYFCTDDRCKKLTRDNLPMVDTQITRAAFFTAIWCFQELKLPRDIVRYKLIPLLLP